MSKLQSVCVLLCIGCGAALAQANVEIVGVGPVLEEWQWWEDAEYVEGVYTDDTSDEFWEDEYWEEDYDWEDDEYYEDDLEWTDEEYNDDDEWYYEDDEYVADEDWYDDEVWSDPDYTGILDGVSIEGELLYKPVFYAYDSPLLRGEANTTALTPEPGALLLTSAGALCLLARRRRYSGPVAS